MSRKDVFLKDPIKKKIEAIPGMIVLAARIHYSNLEHDFFFRFTIFFKRSRQTENEPKPKYYQVLFFATDLFQTLII